MKLKELYEGPLFDCQMLKNLLENEGIEASLQDEIIGTRCPSWRPGFGVRVIVRDTDYAIARQIADAFEKSRERK